MVKAFSYSFIESLTAEWQNGKGFSYSFQVSLCFVLLNLFNPYEWRQRIQRGEIKDQEETDDHFGVKESLWFAMSTLLLQGNFGKPYSLLKG